MEHELTHDGNSGHDGGGCTQPPPFRLSSTDVERGARRLSVATVEPGRAAFVDTSVHHRMTGSFVRWPQDPGGRGTDTPCGNDRSAKANGCGCADAGLACLPRV